MSIHDLKNKLEHLNSIFPQEASADVTGASCNIADAIAVEVVAHIGASGDTLSGSVKIEMELQHSDNNSSWDPVPDAQLQGAVAGTNVGTFAVINDPAKDEAIYKAGYIGGKKFLRVIANFTGTHTNGCPVAAMVIYKDRYQPA